MPNAGQVVDRDGGQMSARRWLRVMLLLAMAGLVFALQACGEEGQDRPLVPDKGTYQGPVDQKLDQEQIEALRRRAGEQRM